LAAGQLKVSSGVVLIGDPLFSPDAVQLENIPPGKHPVTAQVIEYPNGDRRVASVELAFSATATGTPEQVGEVGVDSACVALIDAKAREQFWKEEGPARIGVLSSPQHRRLAKLLRKRFGLESHPVNVVRSEIVEPVSKELEEEIVAYLKTYPEYANHTFIYFRIESRSTCQQLQENLLPHGLWCELVLDKPTGANVLAFTSGFGDDRYPVFGVRGDRGIETVTIEFIDPT
jgi:hypothetical protein